MRRGNYANIGTDWRCTTYTLELTLLQDSQKRHLRLGIQLPNFVEEDRASFRQFKAAETSLQSSRKGSLLMPEQLRGDQVAGDRRAIHAYKRTRSTR